MPADIGTRAGVPLRLDHVPCCICEMDNAEPIAVGEDFEYRTSPDTFQAVRCQRCGLVYLDPRPHTDELDRIYPPSYHAFDFSEERFGLVYQVRRRLEARRLLSWCAGLPPDARILDIGCGDGFHLGLLQEFGRKGWTVEGVDADKKAVEAATKRKLKVHHGTVQQLEQTGRTYHLAILIQTIEHVDNPRQVLESICRILTPGGRLVVVTDNVETLDFRLFGGRHWGGYHFPRHWNLFSKETLSKLAESAGFEVEEMATILSPVNWTYSVRNALVDYGALSWLVNRFSLQSPGSLSVFTAFDALFQALGRGALLRAFLRRPQ
jgi:SAM-dependent methyltransferase